MILKKISKEHKDIYFTKDYIENVNNATVKYLLNGIINDYAPLFKKENGKGMVSIKCCKALFEYDPIFKDFFVANCIADRASIFENINIKYSIKDDVLKIDEKINKTKNIKIKKVSARKEIKNARKKCGLYYKSTFLSKILKKPDNECWIPLSPIRLYKQMKKSFLIYNFKRVVVGELDIRQGLTFALGLPALFRLAYVGVLKTSSAIKSHNKFGMAKDIINNDYKKSIE